MFSVDWSVFNEPALLDDNSWLIYILNGLGWTVSLAAASFMLALVAGILIGTASTLKNRPILHAFTTGWVELFRNIPLIVQIFLWFFVIPEFIPPMKTWMIENDPVCGQFLSAFLCLGLFTSARLAEQIRSGIESLPPGQLNAAKAIGFTKSQAYRYVILPLALRLVLPTMTNEAMNLVKNTSIALTIGLSEVTMRSQEMGEATFQYFAAFTLATACYVIVTLVVNILMRTIEKKTALVGFMAH